MRQLRELIADLHAVPLDRARPLWQYFLIEGLEGGRFAVYAKVHHATMDGMSGMTTMPVIYDFSPVPTPPPPPEPAPAEASVLPQWISGAIDRFFDRQRQLIVAGPKIATALAKVTRRAAATLQLLPDGLGAAPKTLFNAMISKDRSFGTASISLREVRALGKTRNVTVNDIVLAVCAGALSRYLTARHALPKDPLIAAVPVSLREAGQNDLNVQAGVIMCTLATDIADPLARLAAISAAASDSKARLSDIKQTISGNMGDLLGSPLLAPAVAWLAEYTRIYNVLPMPMNLWVSNVPGPRQPFYCAGCKAVAFFPVSIPNHGAALNITNQSYLDRIDFGLVACRTTIPDVQEIADGIVAAFAELKQASDAVTDPSAIEVLEIAPASATPIAAPPVIAIDLPAPKPATPTPKPAPDAAAPTQHSALAGLEQADPAHAAAEAPMPAQHSALAVLEAGAAPPPAQPPLAPPPGSVAAEPAAAAVGQSAGAAAQPKPHKQAVRKPPARVGVANAAAGATAPPPKSRRRP
jgi:WS/DGAT/MGAT family acyltransferase